ATPHVGGNTRWGEKGPFYLKRYKIVSSRWVGMAVLDLGVSIGIDWATGTLNKTKFVEETTGVAASLAIASTTEYLVGLFTASGILGPAGLAGTTMYILTRVAVNSLWNIHETKQLQIQEHQIHIAEKKG